MRQLFLASVFSVLIGLGAAQAGKVEISGAHLCCKQCRDLATKILGKVDGVSDVNVAATIAFTTKDGQGTITAVKALADGGYFGSVKDDGKEVKVELPTPKSEKVDSVTIKGIHVCCGMCKTALKKVFGDATLEYGKANDVKAADVKVTGKDLDKLKLIEALRAAGFNGTIE
jgi:copper chaperone CopZ